MPDADRFVFGLLERFDVVKQVGLRIGLRAVAGAGAAPSSGC